MTDPILHMSKNVMNDVGVTRTPLNDFDFRILSQFGTVLGYEISESSHGDIIYKISYAGEKHALYLKTGTESLFLLGETENE